jgi:hypothetical protein
MDLIYETDLPEFLFVTVLLGGGAAFMSGRAVAQTWRPRRLLVIYVLLLTAAVRFIHHALFQGTLFTLHYYLVDLVLLLAIGFLGYRVTRAGQMATHYSWLYRRTGPLGWRQKAGSDAAT